MIGISDPQIEDQPQPVVRWLSVQLICDQSDFPVHQAGKERRLCQEHHGGGHINPFWAEGQTCGFGDGRRGIRSQKKRTETNEGGVQRSSRSKRSELFG